MRGCFSAGKKEIPFQIMQVPFHFLGLIFSPGPEIFFLLTWEIFSLSSAWDRGNFPLLSSAFLFLFSLMEGREILHESLSGNRSDLLLF